MASLLRKKQKIDLAHQHEAFEHFRCSTKGFFEIV
jgi:hypothetical protein